MRLTEKSKITENTPLCASNDFYEQNKLGDCCRFSVKIDKMIPAVRSRSLQHTFCKTQTHQFFLLELKSGTDSPQGPTPTARGATVLI